MPGTPFDNLVARLDALTQQLAALETRLGEVEIRCNQLIANQIKWAPGYRFSLPPLNIT